MTLTQTPAGLRRDLEIIDLLARPEHTSRGLGVTRIAELLGREKSQVSRALRSLEAEGMVERDPVTRRYRLGWRLFALAARTHHARLVQVAAPYLRRLASEFDEDVHLCVLRGEQVLTLLSAPSSRVYHRIWEGVSVPVIMAGAGRSLLADWEEDQVRRLLRASLPAGLDSAVADEKQWLADLAHARTHGYVVSEVELDDLPGGVSAPVRDHRRLIAAAISMALTKLPPEERLHEMGRGVAQAAAELSAALGCPRA